ncbi:double-strand break repair protein AddB [Sneathiella chungangensis]|uniref:Double-strand break repair protein AddB n=1 Tax=Sneathiella chungangensis TaxID=1418234 RepID=A0A845MLC2_9PROT|nr:double-strand break repair protein AddB [Sneathiella chungangensis]MZR23996.1 double-strand break repair protein AddB [Sneathiella chungangensis]
MAETAKTPEVYNIPTQYSFVDVLARELLRRHGASGTDLSHVTVLTTTRRAARALQNAFLRETAGKPLMLPRMRPIGDVEEDELLLESDIGIGGAAEELLSLPPAIDPLRRQLLLSRLIQARGGTDGSIADAAGLAAALARFLDQVQTEGLDLKGLNDLVPSEYAAHWQVTLEFLEILSLNWPAILQAEGAVDPALRRDLLLRAQVRHWRENPPPGPVYAVGSTGSIPATALLLKTVAGLEQGAVVLPGLDRHLDEKSWQAVQKDPGHAQHGLALLLDRLGITREDVADLTDAAALSSSAARMSLLSEALRPATTSDQWQSAEPPEKAALDGVRLLDCLDAQSEAQSIALLMREALETPEKTAVLITPDRDLSRRVGAELRRWDIEVDDSAGISLDQSPPGVFLRLLARLIESEAEPVALLSALKHPLAAGGAAPEAFRRHVRELELAILRGPRPASGLGGIERALRESGAGEELKSWFSGIVALAAPLEDLVRHDEIDFAEFLRLFIRFAERLSTAQETGLPALWQGNFGEAAAGFISELLRAADVLDEFDPAAWPELLDNLMRGRMVRPQYGLHPRLQIWGPIEGRLGRADLVILGGLNEGSWPPDAGSDPWMSRPMREKFGLPLPEQKIGLSAHDFQQAFGAREVVMTRAGKMDGTPTVPSRWLLRIKTLLEKFGLALEQTGAERVLDWQRQLDKPETYAPILAPRPTPPVTARPRRLSVTRIEKWIKDPYSIFAEQILKLTPLEEIAMDPSVADRGTFIHAALEKFVDYYPVKLPPDARDRLLDFGREAFGDALSYPAVWAFWWPKFERIADWFVGFETARRKIYRTIRTEAKGEIAIPAPEAAFILSGTADRIDQSLGDGTLAILDYKTGAPPSVSEVTTGVSPQLALEAAMLARNGFPGVTVAPVTELAYIQLNGGDPAGKFSDAAGRQGPAAEDLAREAYDGLQRLIAQFDRQATPYLSCPRPDLPYRFNDYDHLARVKEWSSGEEETE